MVHTYSNSHEGWERTLLTFYNFPSPGGTCQTGVSGLEAGVIWVNGILAKAVGLLRLPFLTGVWV